MPSSTGHFYPTRLSMDSLHLLVESPKTKDTLRVPFDIINGVPVGTLPGDSDGVIDVNHLVGRMVKAAWEGPTEFVLDNFEARSLMIAAE